MTSWQLFIFEKGRNMHMVQEVLYVLPSLQMKSCQNVRKDVCFNPPPIKMLYHFLQLKGLGFSTGSIELFLDFSPKDRGFVSK